MMCLGHALAQLYHAGGRLAVFTFQGSEGIGYIRPVHFELNGQALVSTELPAVLHQAAVRLTLAADLALEILRPGWCARHGSLGQVRVEADGRFYVVGTTMGPERQGFRLSYSPDRLQPRGEYSAPALPLAYLQPTQLIATAPRPLVLN